jgi:hypothetical protein
LQEVLAAEGLSTEAWQNARVSWLELAATDQTVHERYVAALADARDRLHRDIAPLFEDVHAWATLLRHSDAHSPSELLALHQLTVGDMARLERHWTRRLGAEPALRNDLRHLREVPEEGEFPELRFGDRKLVPSRFAAQSAVEEGQSRQPATAARSAMGRTAALQSLDPTVLDRLARSLLLAPSSADLARDDRELLERIEREPALRAHFYRRLEHFRRVRNMSVDDRAQADRAPLVLAASGPVALAAAATPPQTSVDETAELDAVKIDLAPMPFRSDPTAVRSDPAPPPHPTRSGDQASADDTGFLDPVMVASPPLPFSEGRYSPPPLTIDTRIGSYEERRPNPIDNTGEVDTVRVKKDATPWEGKAALPELTVSEYARYCAELSLAGGAYDPAIGQRHAVASAESHQQLVERWSRRLSSTPEERMLYQHVFEHHRARLLPSSR